MPIRAPLGGQKVNTRIQSEKAHHAPRKPLCLKDLEKKHGVSLTRNASQK